MTTLLFTDRQAAAYFLHKFAHRTTDEIADIDFVTTAGRL
jgi:hypothetical protein